MPRGIYKNPEERRMRISRAMMGHKLSKSTKIKIGIANRGKPHLSQCGNENHQWKGKEASYFAKHSWIRSHYGKAIKCENKKCIYPRIGDRGMMMAPKRFEWALKKGKEYEHNRKNFIQLCPSCHRKYDRN